MFSQCVTQAKQTNGSPSVVSSNNVSFATRKPFRAKKEKRQAASTKTHAALMAVAAPILRATIHLPWKKGTDPY
jgi:hypothetical protein